VQAEEKATIEGAVVKAGTGQPIRGARITLRQADTTEAGGLDALENLRMTASAGGPVALFFRSNGPGSSGGGGQATAGAVVGSGGPGGPGGPLMNLMAGATGGSSATTDAMGHFTLADIAPGNYRISVQADGFVSQEYGQRALNGLGAAVTLTAGKRLTADFSLLAASVISGRVYDVDGEPLIKTTVQAYAYRYSDGRKTLTAVANAQTNDLGEYRLYWLAPGDYFVGVNARNGSAADVLPVGLPPLPAAGGRNVQIVTVAAGADSMVRMAGGPVGDGTAIYYPGVANPAEAEAVHVGAAAEVQRIDFHLRPQRTVTVSGRVLAPFSLASQAPTTQPVFEGPASATPGRAVGGVVFSAQTAGPSDPGAPMAATRIAFGGPPIELALTRVGLAAAGPLGRNTANVRSDGTFQFDNVAPGSYNLVAIAKDPNGKQHSARLAIEAANDNIRDLVIALQPGHDIRGQIYVDPPPPDGFKMTNLRVSLTPDSAPVNILPSAGAGDFMVAIASPGGVFPGGDAISATVAEDGSFVLKDVGSALDYRVRVTGIPIGGYLADGRMGSADSLAAPVNGADPDASLRLQVGFTTGAVSGTVIDPAGKLYATAVVALVPDKAHSGRSDRYFSATSDSEGRYSFSNVPPGAYRLFAWAEIPSGAFRSPEFLEGFEERAISGTVEKRGAWTETLKLIPASQP
jgi:protocatechuate 3,4-dioxygenase beta subunit